MTFLTNGQFELTVKICYPLGVRVCGSETERNCTYLFLSQCIYVYWTVDNLCINVHRVVEVTHLAGRYQIEGRRFIQIDNPPINFTC